MTLIVCHRKRGVVFDGEIFIGHANEHARGYAAELINEKDLIVEAANMFEHSIRRCDGKTSACEWKPGVRINVNVLYFRKGSSKVDALAYSTRRYIALVRVASF